MRLAWVGLAVVVAVVAGLLVRRASKRSVTVATANLPVSAAARVAIDELSLLGAPRVHGEDTTGLDVEIVLAGEPRVVVQDLAIDADGGVSGSAGNEFLVGILETGVRQIDASATSARMRFEHNILKAVAYVPPHAAAAHRDWFKTYNDWDYELTQREVDEMTGAIVPRGYSPNDSCFGFFGSIARVDSEVNFASQPDPITVPGLSKWVGTAQAYYEKYGFQARLPLDAVESGLYVVHVEGRSRANQDTVVSRDIQIRVR